MASRLVSLRTPGGGLRLTFTSYYSGGGISNMLIWAVWGWHIATGRIIPSTWVCIAEYQKSEHSRAGHSLMGGTLINCHQVDASRHNNLLQNTFAWMHNTSSRISHVTPRRGLRATYLMCIHGWVPKSRMFSFIDF